MSYKNAIFNFASMNESDYEKLRKDNGWGLAISEFRQAQKRVKRPLTLTEAYILDSLWSDHCSYKHSKYKLKSLVRNNRYVLKSEKSDAGAVRIGNSNYYAVFKIESHNHPTLINPYDGAATGVGGILRDIFVMGTKNIGVGASLRYGPKEGPNAKDILTEAMRGASDYCKTMDIPLIALDTCYEESFKHNCLMNVSALGIVRKDGLIPNIVSKHAVGYNLVYIGKPTAGAAVGGASFASQSFEKGKTRQIEFGSNPMLEKATFAAFEKIKKALIAKKIFTQISFKDMGAAGLTCSTAEQVAPRGYGVEILTQEVPTPAGIKVHPLALAVGEDQERNMIIASEKATKVILQVLKKDKDFKKYGGRVAVIGKVIPDDRFIMKDKTTVYCDLPVSLITGAPLYKPASRKPRVQQTPFSIPKPDCLKEKILQVASSINAYSRKDILDILKLKTTGYLVTSPDQTDVCVIGPLKKEKKDKKAGIALVFGGKSIHGRNGSAMEQAYIATVIARLKLAAAGLKPIAVADGCNYGNPDNPEHYYSFSAGIDGLNRACRIPLYREKEPLAVVAGNVSLKNTYIDNGKEESIDPSMIPVVFGYIQDYGNTVTTGLKKQGSSILLAGKRKQEFKGSEYAALHKQTGKKAPSITPTEAGNLEYAVLEASGKGIVLSSAVIENGGLAVALTRMMAMAKQEIGIQLDMAFAGRMRVDYALFTESPGYVIEVETSRVKEVQKIYKIYGISLQCIGQTTKEKIFSGKMKEKTVFEIPLKELKKRWNRQ